jgi:hypothetical protein
MGSQDQALRKTAIPYYANVWGYNRSQNSDEDISSANNVGDLVNLIPSSYFGSGTIAEVNPIRVLQPEYGDIIEANLTLRFTLASAEGARKFRIAIGTYSSRYTTQTSYSEDFITASHRKITGRDTPYDIAPAGELFLPRLNLKPGLYQNGDSEYKDDAFVVLLCFDQAPSKGSGYTFTKFEVNCTMQMGLS